jgi:hypothetical protein
VTVFTQAADNDANGITQNATWGLNDLTIETYEDNGSGTAVLKDRFVHYHSIPNSRMTKYKVTPYTTSESEMNVFEMEFTPSVDLTAAYLLVFEFPTRLMDSRFSYNYFDDDLGTGLQSGDKVPCSKMALDGGGDVATTCVLKHGSRTRYEPAKIEVTTPG